MEDFFQKKCVWFKNLGILWFFRRSGNQSSSMPLLFGSIFFVCKLFVSFREGKISLKLYTSGTQNDGFGSDDFPFSFRAVFFKFQPFIFGGVLGCPWNLVNRL